MSAERSGFTPSSQNCGERRGRTPKTNSGGELRRQWFRPALGQFQIFYKRGHEHPEYQPDFVAEAADAIYMIEVKAENELNYPEVIAKRDVAVLWCANASDYTASYGGKPWRYLLIPHGAAVQNATLTYLAQQHAQAAAPRGYCGNEVAEVDARRPTSART